MMNNCSKRAKISERDDDICQHTDDKTGRRCCSEFHSVMCSHCNLYLCFPHVDIHRKFLLDQRDQLVNEMNERGNELKTTFTPEIIRTMTIEKLNQWKCAEIKKLNVIYTEKLTTIQQTPINELVNLDEVTMRLDQIFQNDLFQPVTTIFKHKQPVSMTQLGRIKQNLTRFDEEKTSLINITTENIVDSIHIEFQPIPQRSNSHFHLSNLDSPIRQCELSVQRSFCTEMAASHDDLLINDREQIVHFTLSSMIDTSPIPELLEWKSNLNGKIVDLHYSHYLKQFFILTDEKLFSYDRLSSFICLHRFTSIPWSCTTMNSFIYLLYKFPPCVEQWTFERISSSISLIKQWNIDELNLDQNHDQHLRCIRANLSHTQLAILIEDDECRWRVGLFDIDLNCLHQTITLNGASTMDWNLVLTFITDRQLLIIDGTTQNIYLIQINENFSLIEEKKFTNENYPINACSIISNGSWQLILKFVKPNMIKFVQI